MTIIYLGGPIDHSLANPSDSFDEMNQIITEALGDDVLLFNPLKAFCNAHKTKDPEAYDFIFNINMRALRLSNFAVFRIDDSPSFGVPIEIYECSKINIPCIVWYQRKANAGIYLKYLTRSNDSAIVSTKDELIITLKKKRPLIEGVMTC